MTATRRGYILGRGRGWSHCRLVDGARDLLGMTWRGARR